MELQVPVSDLLALLSNYLWPFVRIGAFVIVMPLIGGSFVPRQIRLILAVVLTMIIAPAVTTPEVAMQTDMLSIAGLILIGQELLIGIAMGFAVQMVFDAISLGGQVIAMSMGLGFAVFLDRERGVNIPVLGQLFLLLGMMLFLAMNGHLSVIQLIVDSFELLPMSMSGLPHIAMWELAAWSAQIFVVAMKISLPAVTALLVVNLSFGVTSRAAPTLNLFAVGFPIAMLLGFVVIFLSMGSLMENISLSLDDVLTALPVWLSS